MRLSALLMFNSAFGQAAAISSIRTYSRPTLNTYLDLSNRIWSETPLSVKKRPPVNAQQNLTRSASVGCDLHRRCVYRRADAPRMSTETLTLSGATCKRRKELGWEGVTAIRDKVVTGHRALIHTLRWRLFMKKIIACNAIIALSTLSVEVLAQEPSGITTVEQATSGSTDVATTGFQTAQLVDDTPDFTRLSLSAGGLIAQGNTRVQQYTIAGDFGLRRGANQFSAIASLNQGSASTQRDADGTLPEPTETISNYQGRLRYDRFFSKVVSGFVQASALNDKFQALDLRLNIDPGIAIYAINEATHQWSFDVGYDFQYENYIDGPGGFEPEPLSLHSARLATTYVNALNESVTFRAGAEYLIALSPFEQCYYVTDTRASVRCEDYRPRVGTAANDGVALEEVKRTNWSALGYAKLDARVSDKFTVITAIELRHDNSPVQLNYAMNDLRSSINLSYQVF